MSNVRFEESTHSYFLPGGRQLPSVTQILKEAGLIPENEWATYERGTKVHKATELWDYQEGTENGMKIYGDFIDQIREEDFALSHQVDRMVASWSRFQASAIIHDFEIKQVEFALANEPYGFAGKIDRIFWSEKKKRYWVVEIKTGKPQPWHRLQTAAYKFLFSASLQGMEVAPVDRVAVYLEERDFRVEQHDYPIQRCTDKDIFLSALAAANWRIKHGQFWRKETGV